MFSRRCPTFYFLTMSFKCCKLSTIKFDFLIAIEKMWKKLTKRLANTIWKKLVNLLKNKMTR